MARAIHKVWVGCAPSNFLSGRVGLSLEAIVLHRSGASLRELDLRCQQASLHRSSHYAVGADGEVHQYVDEKDTAFHAGIVVSPTWSSLKADRNPNLYTAAIELEGGDAIPPSDAQYAAAAALVAEIAARWNIPIDPEHIVLHTEIRAGVGCPDEGFQRAKLLDLAKARLPEVPTEHELSDTVTLIRSANIRENPSRTARIARVGVLQTHESIVGFEDQGERIQGNSCWYRTADGNYLWAGATDRPNPIRPAPSTQSFIAPALPVPGPCKSGIQSIDALLASEKASPISAATDTSAIGAIQDLLTGHGFSLLPTIASSQYGKLNQTTIAALQSFQKANGLPISATVDHGSLQAMLSKAAVDPRASEVYLTLVLGFPPEGMHKILSLVAQMEGDGKFAALNRNRDRAGLSFGLIQWAQKPGRLVEILSAMSSADREMFVKIFGGGEPSVADGLVANCKKPLGGVDAKTGETLNATFNLVEEPWVSRFKQSALVNKYQQVQVQVALTAFRSSYLQISQFAPELTSERGVAFMLDVANQYGNGGAERLYKSVTQPSMTESDLLQAIAARTVAGVDDSFKAGVRARRQNFLETALLSDRTFILGSDGAQPGRPDSPRTVDA